LFVFWSAFPPAPASAQQNHPVPSATDADEPASPPQDSSHSEMDAGRSLPGFIFAFAFLARGLTHRLCYRATYIHRASASELSLAPLGHHLQASTHTSFGVITTGSVIDRVKLEASVFNGREPNKRRWSIQLEALDFWSTRALVAPTRNLTGQCSIGRLEHPEALEPGSRWRQTASVEYDRPTAAGHWATSLIWGRVHKIATDANLNSYLLESTLNFQQRN
jgi:hypothetical protein